ncbi:MAG: protein translocase subunit SecD [Actinobacteria bacterium]|nr:protein translocase subunit SecD [Actinomycetota bacterium]
MLLGIIGPNIGSPGQWHKDFKVALGLDLSSGTQATLRAVTLKGGKNPPSDLMTQAVAIINNRVNASGSTGVSVQQEGATDIQVTAPGQGSKQLINNVDTTAQLRFRAVLLEGTATATTSPSASATPSASPSASSTAKTKVKASPSASTKAYIEHAAATPSPSAQAGGTASPSASGTAKATPATSASPSPSATGSAAATTAGNPSAVNAATMKLFNKLDCSNLNTWKTKLPYTEQQWDDPNTQTVACGPGSTTGAPNIKYVLDKAVILGTDVTGESAGIDTTSNQWVVNISVNSRAANAFKNLTSTQASKYYPNVSTNSDDAVLDQTAIVLDGNVVTAPQTTEAIPGGQIQITNIGGETAANTLASQLKYGALPLTFKVVNTTTVSASLGKNQLDTGLIAGAIGLILVVIYSFLYYRGLGLVSISSLAIAALLGYLAVVLLSKYQSFTLSLTGIAGLIVAIGITADSFVVFFERLRDEVREGRSLRAAVESGWRRARRTILVSDTVSFLAALLLYIFSVGDVKGFAYTLGLTTLIDVVVVFLFTKPTVTLLARTRFYGQGHKWSGLDAARLGARAPWRSGLPRRTQRTTGSTGRAGRTSGAGRTSRTTSREV